MGKTDGRWAGPSENKPIRKWPAKPVKDRTGTHTSTTRSVEQDSKRGGLGEPDA